MIGLCPWLQFPWETWAKWGWKLLVVTSLHDFNWFLQQPSFYLTPSVLADIFQWPPKNINITFQHFHCYCFASWSSVDAKGTGLHHFTKGTVTKDFACRNEKWKWVGATERPQRKNEKLSACKQWAPWLLSQNSQGGVGPFLDHPLQNINGGNEEKGKRTHGPRQQCGDCWGGGGIKGLNGNGKNTIHIKLKKWKF